MFGQKDIFEYAKTVLILTICFGFIGNYMYVENSKRLISSYNYHDEPLNQFFYKEKKQCNVSFNSNNRSKNCRT